MQSFFPWPLGWVHNNLMKILLQFELGLSLPSFSFRIPVCTVSWLLSKSRRKPGTTHSHPFPSVVARLHMRYPLHRRVLHWWYGNNEQNKSMMKLGIWDGSLGLCWKAVPRKIVLGRDIYGSCFLCCRVELRWREQGEMKLFFERIISDCVWIHKYKYAISCSHGIPFFFSILIIISFRLSHSPVSSTSAPLTKFDSLSSQSIQDEVLRCRRSLCHCCHCRPRRGSHWNRKHLSPRRPLRQPPVLRLSAPRCYWPRLQDS